MGGMSSAPLFGRVLTAMVTPVHPTAGWTSTAPSAWPPTWSTTGTTAWSSAARRGSRRPPPTPRRTSCCGPSSRPWATGPRIVAGVGSNDTAHSVEQRRRPRPRPGAHGVLVVTPYYNKPPQEGLRRATSPPSPTRRDLPVMLYDIPGRSGIAIAHRDPAPARRAPADPWRSRTPRATCSPGSQVMAAHRPAVLLRRRRAQPRPPHPGRRGHRQRRRPRRRTAVRRDGRRGRRRATCRAPSRIHRQLDPRGQRRHEHHPGRDHGQGRTQRAGRHRVRRGAPAAGRGHRRPGRAGARRSPTVRTDCEPSPPRARPARRRSRRTASASSPSAGSARSAAT